MGIGPGDENAADASGRGHLRAARADREQVIATLKAAFVQGRLTKGELDLRVGHALASRTVAELTALTADLPAGLVQAQQWAKAAPVKARPLVRKVVTASACVILAAATLGLAAGLGYAVLTAPMLTSTAMVYLPSSVHDISTQVVIAGSDPVLAGALRTIDSRESPKTLRSAIQVKNVSANVIAFSAAGKTAAQAERTVNAVANSYVAYTNSPSRPGPAVQAQIMTSAMGATTKPLPARLLALSGFGALYGALVGAVGALAFIGVCLTGCRKP